MPPGYDELLATFRKTQTSIQQLISSHSQLESQLNENGMVKEVGHSRGHSHVTSDDLAFAAELPNPRSSTD